MTLVAGHCVPLGDHQDIGIVGLARMVAFPMVAQVRRFHDFVRHPPIGQEYPAQILPARVQDIIQRLGLCEILVLICVSQQHGFGDAVQ